MNRVKKGLNCITKLINKISYFFTAWLKQSSFPTDFCKEDTNGCVRELNYDMKVFMAMILWQQVWRDPFFFRS